MIRPLKKPTGENIFIENKRVPSASVAVLSTSCLSVGNLQTEAVTFHLDATSEKGVRRVQCFPPSL